MNCWTRSHGTRAWLWMSLLATVPLPAVRAESGVATGTVDFARQIRPILANNCYACHGPDEKPRKAHLRLDRKADVFADRDGVKLIVAGKSAESELFGRMTTDDASDRMPPADSGKALTGEQIELVRRWIDQGGRWQEHWAYSRASRPALPSVTNASNARNAIDRFVLAKLESLGLRPSDEADRVTLIRRLHFDLIGLPPTPDEVDAFVGDASPQAYEKLVDRLLASPQYGERMAMHWLDLVRYADTVGYHGDQPYSVWPFRTYVIDAFNHNLPYDEFTIEQLAGDLLPEATRTQRIAAGYNRLNMITAEGGAQDKEYLAKYAADRVRTTSGVWLGATMGCAQCHDHKYDPYTMKDFYSLAAFFADVKEKGFYGGAHVSGGWGPMMRLPDDRQTDRLKQFDGRIAEATKTLNTPTDELAAAQTRWEDVLRNHKPEWVVLQPAEMKAKNGTSFEVLDDGTIVAAGTSPETDTYTITVPSQVKGITALRLDVLPDESLPANGPGRAGNGNFVLDTFKVTSNGKPVTWSVATASHSQRDWDVAGAIDADAKTGWAILEHTGHANHAVFETKTEIGNGGTTKLTFELQQNKGGQHTLGRFRLSATTSPRPVRADGVLGLPNDIAAIFALGPNRRTDAQQRAIAAYYRSLAPELEPTRQALARLKAEKEQLVKSIPTMLATVSVEPRVMRILPRGNWLDESGPVVQPAVPSFLTPSVAAEGRLTRLDLARWMVSRDNPLTARVFINRLWRMYFGTGLSKVLDDLGTQGEPPTHLELLDWLAVEFMERGWNVKHIIKTIVTSATYRQSSAGTAELRGRDPYNRLLARQSRPRLPAEMVRDNALAVSGLLSPEMGGPSVKPYQPAGYYAQLNFPTRVYQPDKGPNQYRRGVYTHWQRTFLHPALLAFDAPTREECTAERPRSNTPLQALVLLNDPTFVEAARVFAERILREGGTSVRERIGWAYRAVLSRGASDEARKVLADLHERHLREYRADPEAAKALIHTGDRPVPANVDAAELAAWTSVARVILNLHETITRP